MPRYIKGVKYEQKRKKINYYFNYYHSNYYYYYNNYSNKQKKNNNSNIEVAYNQTKEEVIDIIGNVMTVPGKKITHLLLKAKK
ncbi:MAG: hypothetical protein L6V91_06010 [Bacilli bacterium]|nr:MAG: hypothetical protein L6V91_06010 [Bacilli bacterium]